MFGFFKPKKKSFFVRLTGRGGKTYIIGQLQAKDINDLLNQIQGKIESLGEGVKAYKFIRITNLDNNQEIKVENPLYDPSLDTQVGRSTSSSDFSAILNETMMKAYISNLVNASKLSTVITAEVLKGVLEGVKGLIQSVISSTYTQSRGVKPVQETTPSSLKDIATIAKLFMDMANNPTKYEDLVKKAIRNIETKEKEKNKPAKEGGA